MLASCYYANAIVATPESGQKTLLAKAFGCARVVWNDALALNRRLHEEKDKIFDAGALLKRCITEAKRTEERSWLSDASHSVLQQSLRALSQAFRDGGCDGGCDKRLPLGERWSAPTEPCPVAGG